MRTAIRHAAAAFTTGAVIAVLLDLILRFATGSVRISGGMMLPWWVRLAENSVWIALGLVLWLAAPLLGDWIDDVVPRASISRRTIWELIGIGLLALPPGHVLGQWLVLAMQLTVSGTWGAEGRIFMSGAYYGNVLLSITPWMAAGAVIRGWAHHMVHD